MIELEMSIQAWPRLESLVLELVLPLLQGPFLPFTALSAGFFSGSMEFALALCPNE
jgi:hypothetical protein